MFALKCGLAKQFSNWTTENKNHTIINWPRNIENILSFFSQPLGWFVRFSFSERTKTNNQLFKHSFAEFQVQKFVQPGKIDISLKNLQYFFSTAPELLCIQFCFSNSFNQILLQTDCMAYFQILAEVKPKMCYSKKK